MDGAMTGYNPELAKRQLDQFVDMCNQLYIEAGNAVDLFNRALVNNWTSPKAANMNGFLHENTNYIGNAINSMCNTVAMNAVTAIRYLAMKNGSDFQYGDGISLGGGNYFGDHWVDLKESGVHGVGMNKNNVIYLILPDFRNSLNSVKEKLNNLPLDLAVYDPSGRMKEAYIQLITKCKADINQCVLRVDSEINQILTQEVDNITIGVNQAVETMTA